MRNPFKPNNASDAQQNGTTQTGTYQDDPHALDANERYRIARQIEINIAEKAHQNEQSWRRIAFVEVVLLALALIAIVVLGAKNQHDVLVYRDDAHGLHVMSEAISTRTPTREEVEAQIVRWLRGLRDVPGGRRLCRRRSRHSRCSCVDPEQLEGASRLRKKGALIG